MIKAEEARSRKRAGLSEWSHTISPFYVHDTESGPALLMGGKVLARTDDDGQITIMPEVPAEHHDALLSRLDQVRAIAREASQASQQRTADEIRRVFKISRPSDRPVTFGDLLTAASTVRSLSPNLTSSTAEGEVKFFMTDPDSDARTLLWSVRGGEAGELTYAPGELCVEEARAIMPWIADVAQSHKAQMLKRLEKWPTPDDEVLPLNPVQVLLLLNASWEEPGDYLVRSRTLAGWVEIIGTDKPGTLLVLLRDIVIGTIAPEAVNGALGIRVLGTLHSIPEHTLAVILSHALKAPDNHTDSTSITPSDIEILGVYLS